MARRVAGRAECHTRGASMDALHSGAGAHTARGIRHQCSRDRSRGRRCASRGSRAGVDGRERARGSMSTVIERVAEPLPQPMRTRFPVLLLLRTEVLQRLRVPGFVVSTLIFPVMFFAF